MLVPHARSAERGEIAAFLALFTDVVAGLEIYCPGARAAQFTKHTEATLRRRLESDADSLLVVDQDGTMNGFAIVEDQNGPIWIEWYGVAPAARGAGVGAALIDHIVDLGCRRGSPRIWCDTHAGNVASIGLLRKKGFRTLCALPRHWYGHDFLLWSRDLGEPAGDP